MIRTLLLLPILALAGLSAAAAPLTQPDGGAARKTVAVLNFDNNSGDAQYDALGKGIASMMISDLSGVQSIRLVERERLQDVMTEQNLQHSRHVDPATAVRLGRIAGAEYVVIGSLVAMRPSMRVDTRVIRVETAEIVKTAQVTGREDRFFELQQKLARELVNGLDVALSPEDAQRLAAQQERNRMNDLAAVVTLSHAMDLADHGDYVGAIERMAPVVRAHPNSALVALTYDAMKDKAARDTKREARQRLRNFIRKNIP